MRKEVSQKNVIIMFSSFILLGVLFSFCIYNEYYCIDKIDIKGFTNNNILFSIDSIENKPQDKIIDIKGWAFKQHENLNTVKTYVALKNIETSEVFKVNTVKQERNDVTLYFNDSYNYNHSGFIAKFDKNALKSKGSYEICILYLSDNNTDFVSTGKLISIS